MARKRINPTSIIAELADRLREHFGDRAIGEPDPGEQHVVACSPERDEPHHWDSAACPGLWTLALEIDAGQL